MATSIDSSPDFSDEYEVIRKNLPRLIDKIFPDEISDGLFSLGIISEDIYIASCDRSASTRKERCRKLILEALIAIKKDRSVFQKFCSVLLESRKPSISELARQLQGDLDATTKLSVQEECKISESGITEESHSLTQLKQDLELLRKSLLQSDENVEAKQLLMKEFICRYIRQSFESGDDYSTIRFLLEKLCTIDMLIPQALQKWCFTELNKQSDIYNQQNTPVTESVTNAGPPPLFSKDNIYHSLFVSKVVSAYNSQSYESYFKQYPHEFNEVSMSEDSQAENKTIERYLLARKNNTLFVAFNGEPNLISWQQKYPSLDEGISCQKESIPIRFFVEYLRKGDGNQLIFTGFSFGASLAMAVHADLWNQTSLSIRELEENVACIGFGPPIFTVSSIKQILNEYEALQFSTRIFYLEDDVLPRLFQCADFPKPKDPDTTGSVEYNKLYPGTISGDAMESLSELQSLNKPSDDKLVESLKRALKAAVPSTQIKLSVYGLVYNVYQDQGVFKISEPLNDPDNLQYPNESLVESLQVDDLFSKHSVDRYHSVIVGGLSDAPFVGTISSPSKRLSPLPLKSFEFLKPEVTKAKFFRHADEVAIVLEGLNLWFCHQIKVGTRNKARIIINPKGQETTMRSIIFNYSPEKENDLLINPNSSKVTITLYSHFCKSITQRDVKAEPAMDDYAISFRQRQLAKLTPADIIRISLLSAMLEKSSVKSEASNASSSHFQVICQFLQDVTRIVPIESICNAIEYESDENSWKCAEALFDSEFVPKPSVLFADSLGIGLLRLKSGIPVSDLKRFQNEAIQQLLIDQKSSVPYPVQSTIQVSEKEVVFTAVKGITETTIEKDKKGMHLKQKITFGNTTNSSPSFSDVVRGERSISVPKPKSQFDSASSGSKHAKIVSKLNSMLVQIKQELQTSKKLKILCDANIAELYPHHKKRGQKSIACLKPPIDFLKETKEKLAELQHKAQTELSIMLDDSADGNKNEGIENFNEEMIEILNEIMSQDVAICLSLLGAFMQQQINVPFVNTLSETAHVLQTTESSSAVGVWTLFSLGMLNMQSLLKSSHGKLCVEVEKYVEGILSQRDSRRQHSSRHSPDRGGYAGKLQFLMVSMGETVSCNSQYISYSLERQLSKLCTEFDIKPETRVNDIIRKWDSKFSKSILYHVMVEFRPLLARWLLWSLNIHKLREELASHTTVGIVGLSKSGKSCLVKNLFNQDAISGTARIQRTTVPFLYNLEGEVDGLSIADFPGVDDKDKTVVNISKILLQLSQIIVLVIDYRRISTQSAMEWIEQLDKSGVPVLLCLTHGDKLYANECLKQFRENCTIDMARRIVGREFENIKKPLPTCPTRKVVLCSFCQDADSILNCDEGRHKLSKIGIASQEYVGTWLVEQLKHQQQNLIADKLHQYLTKGFSEKDSVEKSDCKLETALPIPELPPEVIVYGEKAVELLKSESNYCINWHKFGLKITIPPDALAKDVTCTVALKVVEFSKVENYVLPKDVEVVSAFYWIFSSHKFLKPVTLEIKHCAQISQKSTLSQMKIVTAKCNEGLPYKFRKRDADFQLNSRQGQFSTRQFSFFGFVRDKLFGSDPDMYYIYMVLGKKVQQRKLWHFDLYFMKDVEPFIEKINQKRNKEGWIDDTPPTSFDFNSSSDGIDILLPPDSEKMHGWKIKQKPCRKINRSMIDRCLENTSQQYCRIAFMWERDCDPCPLIDYTITLKGIAVGSLSPHQIKLSVPIGKYDSDNGNPPVVVPPIHVDNRPVIEVNTVINVT